MRGGLRLMLLLLLTVMGLGGCNKLDSSVPAEVKTVAGGDVGRGAQAIRAYGCDACHLVPGVRGADSMVGPPLTKFASRQYIAGRLPNEADHLEQWIRNPQGVKPGTAMPNMGVGAEDARDIAAYLYTLR